MTTGLLILRLVFGMLLMAHGAQKGFGWFRGPGLAGISRVLDAWGFTPGRAMGIVAATVEIGSGLLLALGAATPLACAGMIGILLVATAPNLHNGLWATKGGFELAFVYLVVGIALAFTGPGRISVDHAAGTPHGDWLGVAAVALGFVASVVPLTI